MKNKTVLITGGASGIGLAMVQLFAAKMTKVYFIDINLREDDLLNNS